MDNSTPDKLKVKLIYNPKAGETRKNRIELPDIIREMALYHISPDISVLDAGIDLTSELYAALEQGISTFVACGGDGTISTVSNILAGTNAKLAIIPCGTQNNDAKSLRIPQELPDSVALIRTGKLVQIDMGVVVCNGKTRHFMEIVSVGLVAAVTDSGDAIQHGHLSGLVEFLSTLATFPPARISLRLDNDKHIEETGYIALVTNMPYTGFHYQFGQNDCYHDGFLHVLFFADLSKIDLFKYISKGIHLGKLEDPRIQHYHVRELEIVSDPPMPIMADGYVIGEGNVQISIKQKALAVISGH